MALVHGPSGTPETNVKPVWLNLSLVVTDFGELTNAAREETIRVVINGKDLDTLRSLMGGSEDIGVVRLKSVKEKTFSGTKIYGEV